MTRLKTIFICAMAGLLSVPAMAQSESDADERPANVVERIEQESLGKISIEIPEELIQKLMQPDEHKASSNTPNLRPGINKLTGYRIQVFSDGRNQHSLEQRAKSRGNAIAAKFPKYRGQVYSFSSSPNWYTRVGNFRTSAEASAALAELKRAFPQYASEMRVVKSQIVVIK